MSIKLSRGRFNLLAATFMYKRETEMKQLRNRCLTFFAAMLFLSFTAGNVMAGGLVNTSVERFLAADFTTNPSANITNPWWTLPAGDNFLYFALDGDDCVWNLTEVMNATTSNFAGNYAGTDARIVLDRGWVDEGCEYGTGPVAFFNVWNNLPPEEATYDWYAQDSEMNIWYMGENTFDGDFSGSFVAGCDGAVAGIVVLGNPSKGDFYQQEFYEDKAEDWGKVLNFIKKDGLVWMKTKEWTPLEHGAIEHKFYSSDGTVGVLSLIEELKGKTVIVNLVDRNVGAPPPPAGPINPIPSCP
ncbi:MAG: hypothetical protein OEN50_17440 [Deltaproteobacteria bacterium]|nr:hypothetical protein [Deltaproteobacteria bacterium]